MKTIEERATEYVDTYYYDNFYPQSLSEIEADAKSAFIAGAKSERKELTRWHDPKADLPQRNIDVLVMLRDTYRGGKIHFSVGYINGACWFGDSIGATDDVIGWREIHE